MGNRFGAAALALVALALTSLMTGACSKAKPTQEQCHAACYKSFEIHHEHVLGVARTRAGSDMKQMKENLAKAEEEWAAMKASGREDGRIKDCTLKCMVEGTTEQTECISKATSIKEMKRCKKP